MKFSKALKENYEDIGSEQIKYAQSMMQKSGEDRPKISPETLKAELLKTTLSHSYKPNEYKIGINGEKVDVNVADKTFSGSFDTVLKNCYNLVIKK